MRNWKYPHLRHRPRTSGTRIMRLHPRSLLTMTSPWPRLVFFPQDFWLCQQITGFFFISPLLCQGLGGYEAFDHRWLCGHGGEPVIWGTGGGWRWQGGALCDSKVHTSLPWEFVPQQRRVVVGLGEPTWEGMDFFFVVEVERCLFSCI